MEVSRPADTTRRKLLLLGLLLGLPLAGPALAADCTENVRIEASDTQGSVPSRVVLDGKVRIRHCGLVVQAAHGVAHIENGKVVRVELTGDPATVNRNLESARLAAHARNIEYQVGTGNLVLSGDAHVDHSARGSYDGARLTYNSSTGAISGSGGADGLVHLVLKPDRNAEPAPPPAGASSAPPPATSATVD